MIKTIKQETSIFLDFFRGISAQIVLLGHLLSFYGYQDKFNIPIIQNFGVIVFFILSGFLIVQTSLLKTKEYGFDNFLLDRFSRIFYSFIPALIFVFSIDYIVKNFGNSSVYNGNDTVLNFFGNIFMLQNYPLIWRIGIEPFGSGRPFWTVSIEWWLYITWGFLFYFCSVPIRKVKKIYWFLFVLSLPVFFYNIYIGSGLSLIWIFGLLLALIYNKFDIVISRFNFIILGMFAGIGIFLRTFLFPNMYDLGIALFFSLIIFLTFYIPENFVKKITVPGFAKFSSFLASFSYSLYLIHYTIIEFYLAFFKERSLMSFFIVFIVSNILAYGFYLIFEKNNFMLKKKIRKHVFNYN